MPWRSSIEKDKTKKKISGKKQQKVETKRNGGKRDKARGGEK